MDESGGTEENKTAQGDGCLLGGRENLKAYLKQLKLTVTLSIYGTQI